MRNSGDMNTSRAYLAQLGQASQAKPWQLQSHALESKQTKNLRPKRTPVGRLLAAQLLPREAFRARGFGQVS